MKKNKRRKRRGGEVLEAMSIETLGGSGEQQVVCDKQHEHRVATDDVSSRRHNKNRD